MSLTLSQGVVRQYGRLSQLGFLFSDDVWIPKKGWIIILDYYFETLPVFEHGGCYF